MSVSLQENSMLMSKTQLCVEISLLVKLSNIC